MLKLFLLALALLPAAALARDGVVSAADPRAAAAGVEVLQAGGSATDAAIATMLALNVVEPQSAGIGGGGFFTLRDAKTGAIVTIDGREAAPMKADERWFLGADGKPVPKREAIPSGRSVGVPGTLRAMELAHRRAGKLPWARLFQPAIRLAEQGFAVSPRLNRGLTQALSYAGGPDEDASARTTYYGADGQAKPVGALVRNPELAATFRLIAAKGADAFYRGAIARRIVAVVNGSPRRASAMTPADLTRYQAKARTPLCGSYRAYRICGIAPPASGVLLVLEALKQLEPFDLARLGKDSAAAWHLIAESQRLAYADRDRYVADPDYVPVPTPGLLDPAYLKGRAALISPTATMPRIEPGTPPGAPKRAAAAPRETPGTTSLAVADAAGNVAVVTFTIEGPYGSGLTTDGFFLNNELTDFDLSPERDGLLTANRVEGGKRPRSSMGPLIVLDRAGEVRLAIGAAGGSTIPAQILKAVIGVLDWGLSAQDAIALPLIYAPTKGGAVEQGTTLERLLPDLADLGDRLVPSALGLKANAIERVGGRWTGGADPRSEGAVLDADGRVLSQGQKVPLNPTGPAE